MFQYFFLKKNKERKIVRHNLTILIYLNHMIQVPYVSDSVTFVLSGDEQNARRKLCIFTSNSKRVINLCYFCEKTNHNIQRKLIVRKYKVHSFSCIACFVHHSYTQVTSNCFLDFYVNIYFFEAAIYLIHFQFNSVQFGPGNSVNLWKRCVK